MDYAGIVVKIIPHGKSTPVGKLADAELHFVDGPMRGLRLLGFTIWGKQRKATNVTFPDRPYTTGQGEKRKYVLLRPQDNAAQDRADEITTLILSAYEKETKTCIER